MSTCKITQNSELFDFEKDVTVGYHRNGRSLRDISSEQKFQNRLWPLLLKAESMTTLLVMLRGPPWFGMMTTGGTNCTGLPDLNPVEDLWDKLDHRIKGCNNRSKSVKELVCLLQAG
ncbi:hypothetical protein TNCV_2768721 [Trichonephila clavipes]|nr:hypothetical protein TNCV_2768721 [Trichonephila clavipes]